MVTDEDGQYGSAEYIIGQRFLGGMNFFVFPPAISAQNSSKSLLNYFGSKVVRKIEDINTQEVCYFDGEALCGPDFSLEEGKGYLLYFDPIYYNADFLTDPNNLVNGPKTLEEGINLERLSSFSLPEGDRTTYQSFEELNNQPNQKVPSVLSYEAETGKYQPTLSFFGHIAGVNKRVRKDELFLIYKQQ